MSGVYGKPLHDYRSRLDEFRVPVVPDFVIDDYPGIVKCFGGLYITEYFGAPFGADASSATEDRELEVVYELVTTFAAGGVPDHPRYYAREG